MDLDGNVFTNTVPSFETIDFPSNFTELSRSSAYDFQWTGTALSQKQEVGVYIGSWSWGEAPQNGGGWAWCEEAQGVGGRARWEKVIASALGIGVVRRSEASGVGRVANWPEATAGGIRARRIMAKAVVLGARRPKA